MRLSVLIPVYDEEATIRDVIGRVRATGLADEIVVVDDGSRDRSREVLAEYSDAGDLRVIIHDRNMGKGAALRTAMLSASGDVLLVQDADLEYDPAEYPRLLEPLRDGSADVVYGSRFLAGAPAGVPWATRAANKLLTSMTNLLYRGHLTDMETCYKVFRRDVIEGMRLRANRFDFEPEFTAKVLKRGFRIREVPVAFRPRGRAEGKKIGFRDGVMAVWALLRYRLTD